MYRNAINQQATHIGNCMALMTKAVMVYSVIYTMVFHLLICRFFFICVVCALDNFGSAHLCRRKHDDGRGEWPPVNWHKLNHRLSRHPVAF